MCSNRTRTTTFKVYVRLCWHTQDRKPKTLYRCQRCQRPPSKEATLACLHTISSIVYIPLGIHPLTLQDYRSADDSFPSPSPPLLTGKRGQGPSPPQFSNSTASADSSRSTPISRLHWPHNLLPFVVSPCSSKAEVTANYLQILYIRLIHSHTSKRKFNFTEQTTRQKFSLSIISMPWLLCKH